ncbi:ribokinase [Paenibacillus methanolicus]|uniref:Ribokinase n=1 Tax=Paenibacillus methanolicus TaxID=582686 RepID=A0A5S5CDZ1_9BACL|nr:ribokinase [Paenibacillus methanolicus]TYP76712.1 ribokinase [Paenibacillus methanolicus]
MTQPNLLVIGSLNMDIVVQTARYPLVGETITGENVHFIPGGKGANQAIAAARLGAETAMIGAVGQDAFGENLLHSLEKEGVDVSGIKQVAGVATGVASIYIAEGDNSIVVVPGANNRLEFADIDRNEALLRQADIVLLQLEIPEETVLYAASKAKIFGKTVVLNPAPAKPIPDELFQLADYITPNRTELGRYTGMETDGSSLGFAMQRMKEIGEAHIVTTLGSAGSAYIADDGSIQTIPGHKVPVVDTTGAGDCYNAGLAISIATGRSLEEAVNFASLVSALAVTKFGAQAGMPTIAEVRAFEAERNKTGADQA